MERWLYAVLDNLKSGVIRPDLYEPEINAVYAAFLAHYGVVADTCRVADPNRKGTVENAIQHTQDTALKGRTFESVEAQNAWLRHWEERWAAPRIHGRKKRQVLAMFEEERPHLSLYRSSRSASSSKTPVLSTTPVWCRSRAPIMRPFRRPA